jgi:hypothetical protein
VAIAEQQCEPKVIDFGNEINSIKKKIYLCRTEKTIKKTV